MRDAAFPLSGVSVASIIDFVGYVGGDVGYFVHQQTEVVKRHGLRLAFYHFADFLCHRRASDRSDQRIFVVNVGAV